MITSFRKPKPRGRMVWVAADVFKELETIKQAHQIQNEKRGRAKAMDILVQNARLGRQLKQSDLLGANLLFIQSKRGKKKRKNGR